MSYADNATALHDATLALCGDAGLAVRLERAHAFLLAVDATRLPGSLGVRFDELVADLGYGGDTIAGALAGMNTVDQERLAGRLVRLYGDLNRWLPMEE